MLLDQLLEHLPERHLPQYIRPNLLSAIYSATGRRMSSNAGRLVADPDEEDEQYDDQPTRKTAQSQDMSRRGPMASNKNYLNAEEIEDDLDYAPVDD